MHERYTQLMRTLKKPRVGETVSETYHNNILSFPVDFEGYQYIREILIQMSSRFPLSVKEALVLVNSKLSHTAIIGEDIFYHDTPEAWSKHFYWGHENLWWKKGEERKEYNLTDLKPIRNDKVEIYELWESITINEETDETLFFPSRLLDELKEQELLPNDYKLVWMVEANNYNNALEALHQYKDWPPYREEC